MSGDRANPIIPVACPIETRDGTLTKDARMVNCYVEQNDNGNAAVKRPGTVVGATVPTGTPQCIGRHAGHVYAIVSDVIYQVDVVGVAPATALGGVTNPGEPYQVLSDIAVGQSGFKSSYGMWLLNGAVITKVTDPNYPVLTCNGGAWLDGSAYVVEISATPGTLSSLRGSDLNDPETWNPLNYIDISTSAGQAVYCCNYLNYVAVFLEAGLQLFYDSGNATGSPLSPVPNASWLTGCDAPLTVVKIVDDLFFVSKSSLTGYSVSVLSGLTLSTISTPAVERLLNKYVFTKAIGQSFKSGGHSFYGIYGSTAGGYSIHLVFDLTTKTWSEWTSYVGGAEVGFVGINAISQGATYYMQDVLNGTMLQLTDSNYEDGTGTVRGAAPIYARMVTRPFDWNTLKRKFFAAVYLIADTVSSTLSLRYSDDDYTTFSSWRTIDMSTVKKWGSRFGSSRRRSWELLHTANTPLRVYGIEVDAEKSIE